MNRRMIAASLCAVLLFCAGGLAADLPVASNTFVKDITSLTRSGTLPPDKATVETIDLGNDAPSPGVTQAIRVTTPGKPDNSWDIGLTRKLDQPISKGEVVYVQFYARTHQAMVQEGHVAIAIERAGEPYDKILSRQFSPPRDHWQRYDLPIVSSKAFDANAAQVTIQLGFADQSMDLTGLTIRGYPAGTDLKAFPSTPLSYQGRDPDAPWRKAALERIDKIRKADLAVHVVDAAGKPASGQSVQIKMKSLDFEIGTAVNAQAIVGNDPSDEVYRQKIEQLFNTVVFENDLKWHENVQVTQTALKATDWLRDHHIAVRGHNMLWPSYHFSPKRLQSLPPDQIRAAIDERVSSIARQFAGKVVDWDVINEPYNNTDFEKLFGRKLFVDVFKLARENDPNARLFVNDWGILASGNSIDTPHQQQYYDLIQYLKDQGAPIGGIGMQGHFGSNLTDPENLLKIFDRFSQLGLPMLVTEFDITTTDRKLQADYLRDFFIAAFSQPGVDGVVQWGFWQGRDWQPDAAMFQKDWTLRPHGQVFLDLMNQWKTDQTVVTDAQGNARLRAFRGDYQIIAGNAESTLKLTPAGGTVQLQIK